MKGEEHKVDNREAINDETEKLSMIKRKGT